MERHEGKGHESNCKGMNGQVSTGTERKGKVKGNYFLEGGKQITRSDGAVFLFH